MNRSAIKAAFALFLVLLLVAAGKAGAGANETPGRGYRPHAFGYFSANQWEFGARDVTIVQKYVVRSQHYTQGAAYVDAVNDAGTGGAGVWNFFVFCTDRRHDVMLVTSHGVRTPATIIAEYSRTAAGLAARDSTLAYWNGIFVAGSLVGGNYASMYTINATQTFYTTYFQTPQAFCWWATCWSSLLAMTGAAEARDFLGYDNVVASSKCYCDEETILNKMDGQQGQALRPLTAAFAGINGICPPGGARLVRQGAGNTVLSPSVIENTPTGIVCVTTPGHVKFDCTMDTTVPPATVVKAFGDGILVNHHWVGDDQVEYDVVPIRPCPTIFYDVVESRARSRADRARLDGNTNPAVNARGPNQDDFVWVTICPWCNWPPVTVPDNVCIPDPSPGLDVTLYTPVVNQTTDVLNLTVQLDVTGIPLEITNQSLVLPPQAGQTLTWPVVIPPNAVEGQLYATNLTILGGPGGSQTFPGRIVVAGRVGAELVQPIRLQQGQTSSVDVTVGNLSGAALTLTDVSIADDEGWSLPAGPLSIELEPGEAVSQSFQVHVPPGTPPGTTSEFRLQYRIGQDAITLPIGEGATGLPISIVQTGATDVVPGNTNAVIPIEIASLSLASANVIYQATDSNNFPVMVQAPSTLPPGATVSGQLVFAVPANPSLVGMEGSIHLVVRDAAGYAAETDLSYRIEPAIEIIAESQSVFTGRGSPGQFPWPIRLRNRADVPQNGVVRIQTNRHTIQPPVATFNLPPNGMSNVNAMILIAPDAPVGPFQATVSTESGQPIGNTTRGIEHEVTTPVVVDAVQRAMAGTAGQPLELKFALWNRRTDAAMAGSCEVSDARGWTLSLSHGSYALAPGARDTLRATLLIPANAANGDSNVVTMTVHMTYDTGLEAEMRAAIDVIVETGSGSSDVPAPTNAGAETGMTSLDCPSPNPFGGSTQVSFRLARSERVRVSVHDVQGRRVAILADGVREAGQQAISWDGRSEGRKVMPDGIYFVQMETPEGKWVRKVVRMKK